MLRFVGSPLTATSLSDLSADAWWIVARRELCGGVNFWVWTLPEAEAERLRMGRERGLYFTAQRREGEGWLLLGRCARDVRAALAGPNVVRLADVPAKTRRPHAGRYRALAATFRGVGS